jgi:calcineurin-like phosphoesterase family protein
MPLQLTKTYPRLWSLAAGVAVVVTDLHGDRDRYVRYRDRFLALRAEGQADCLICTGDLIHREPGVGTDGSLAIVLDLLHLREHYGDAIVILCGNHELPHLYGFVLAKRSTEYTPAFEAALSASGRRADVLALLDSLPFFIRTASGVAIAHAGASTPLADAAQAMLLFNWDHQAVRTWPTRNWSRAIALGCAAGTRG